MSHDSTSPRNPALDRAASGGSAAIPITPGGLGITELGLIGIVPGGAGHEVSAQATAAVLLYPAVTYLP